MPAGQILDVHTVRFERDFSCTLETLWDYLTQPGRLSTWLAEGIVETHVGGRVELTFDVEEIPERQSTGDVIHGVVSLCVPRRVLAYTWMSAEDAGTDSTEPTSTVTFELEPGNGHTKLTLTHRHLRLGTLARCAAGWDTHLEVLTSRILNRQPEPFLATWRRLLPVYEEQALALRA